jgi:toxin ParE1/3/4
MTFDFHPEALAELSHAAGYYAEQSPGLELRFLAEVERAIDRISADPERWRTFAGDVRRALVHVFPFGVLYTLHNEAVVVLAVMHLSREPGYWKSRAMCDV